MILQWKNEDENFFTSRRKHFYNMSLVSSDSSIQGLFNYTSLIIIRQMVLMIQPGMYSCFSILAGLGKRVKPEVASIIVNNSWLSANQRFVFICCTLSICYTYVNVVSQYLLIYLFYTLYIHFVRKRSYPIKGASVQNLQWDKIRHSERILIVIHALQCL